MKQSNQLKTLLLHVLLVLSMTVLAEPKVSALPDCSGKTAKEAWCRQRYSEKDIKRARQLETPNPGGVLGHYAGVRGNSQTLKYSVLKPQQGKKKKSNNGGG